LNNQNQHPTSSAVGSRPTSQPSTEPVAQQQQRPSSSVQSNPSVVEETSSGSTSTMTTTTSTSTSKPMKNVITNAPQNVVDTTSTTTTTAYTSIAAKSSTIIGSTPTSQPVSESVVQQQQLTSLAPATPSVSKSTNPKGNEPILKDPSSAHLSNDNESSGNLQSIPSTVGSKPANQPVSAPISEQLRPSSTQETDSTELTNESDIPCNLCKQGRVNRNDVANFNGKQINCLEAYNVMTNNFKERSTSCITAQSSISNSCCFESQKVVILTTPNKTVTGEIAESGTSPSYPAPSSLSNPAERQPTGEVSTYNDESPPSFTETESKDSYTSTRAGNDNSPGGDQGNGEPDWLVYWDNSSPPSNTPMSLAIAIVTLFSLWLSWA